MDHPRFDQLNLNHMNLLTSQACVPSLAHPQMQPTLTQLVRWGIANDDNDYIMDTGRIQDPLHTIGWHEQEGTGVGAPKTEIISQSAKEFLEQNDMIPISQHIPPESLTYLVEDDNSYLKLEHDLHNNNVDVIGEAFASSIHKPVERSSGTNAFSNSNAFSSANAFSSSSNAFSMEVDIIGGQRTIFPSQNHVNVMSTDHRISLQRLLGLGSHHHELQLQMQQARPILNPSPRPILSPFIANHQVFSPHLSSTFHKFHVNKLNRQKAARATETTGMKRKYVKRMSNEEQIQKGNNLWQFLMRLLGSRGDLVSWTGHDLEFKIVNKEEIAKMWGVLKNREKMNFDKFSRALRYYYNKRILIHNPQCRLTYCFMRNPKDPVFCAMLQKAMRTIPNYIHVCGAMCDNTTHPHEMQYAKRKVRGKSSSVSFADHVPDNRYAPFQIHPGTLI